MSYNYLFNFYFYFINNLIFKYCIIISKNIFFDKKLIYLKMFLALLILWIKLFFIFGSIFLFYIIITQLIHYKLRFLHNRAYKNRNIKTISFVHPFCADCGGGEKVLWRMITSLISYYQNSSSMDSNELPNLKINIISGRNDDLEELYKKLKSRFGIDLQNDYSISRINKKLVLEIILQELGQQ